LFTAAVGSVVAYDAVKQVAQIRLVSQLPIENQDGTMQYLEFPILQDVPVCFLRAGNYSITFPIAAGDSVLMVFTQLDAGKWRDTGNVPTLPQTVKLHALGHGFAIPIVAPRSAALSGAAEPALSIVGDEIRLGAATAADVDAVALASRVEQDNQTLFDAISNATTGTSDGGAAFKAAIVTALTTAGYPNNVGSSNVKAKK
jgi:hypothetical protein